MPLESVYLNGGFIGTTTSYQLAQAASTQTITYVGSASSDNSTTIDLTGISMQPGDVVVVISGEDSGAPATATGYTSLAAISSTGDVNVMGKIMPDPVDTSVTGLTAASDCGHLAVVFRGVDQTTPFDTTVATATSTAGDPNPAAITTVTNGAMVVALAFLDDDLISTPTPPSGYTLADFHTFGVSGTGGSVMVVYKEVATAGSEDPGTIVTSGDDWWWAATGALRPGTTAPIASNDGIFNLQAVLESISSSLTNYDYETVYGTPSYTVSSFPSTDTGVNNGNTDLLVAIDVNISASDTGILIDLGGNAGTGFAVGVNNGTLRARAFTTTGDSAWNTDAGSAEIEVNISTYTGSLATYYFAVDSSAYTMKVYVQPGGRGSVYPKILLGSDTSNGTQSNVYGTDSKGFGQVSGGTADLTASYEGNFSGTIGQIRYWSENVSYDFSGF